MLNVDVGVERPVRRHGNAKYPLRWMAVDESFFVNGGNLVSLRRHCGRMGPYYGRRFECADVVENGVAGVRVWRVE